MSILCYFCYRLLYFSTSYIIIYLIIIYLNPNFFVLHFKVNKNRKKNSYEPV